MDKNDKILLNEITRNAAKIMLNQGLDDPNILDEYEKIKHLISYKQFYELSRKRVISFYTDVI